MVGVAVVGLAYSPGLDVGGDAAVGVDEPVVFLGFIIEVLVSWYFLDRGHRVSPLVSAVLLVGSRWYLSPLSL